MKNDWELEGVETVLQTIPFNVEKLNLVDPKTKKPVKSSYHRLDCPNWVNTFVITKEKNNSC